MDNQGLLSRKVREYTEEMSFLMKRSEKEFLAVYDTLSDAIFRHAYYRLLDRHKARDIMQEAFTRVWNALQEGKKIENLKAFLYTVTNHLIVDDVRKKHPTAFSDMHKESEDEEGSAYDPPSSAHIELFMNTEAKRTLEESLRTLDGPYRAIVVMRFVDDMSPKEIAEATGERENTVSVRLHRAIRKMREETEGKGDNNHQTH